MPTTTPAQLLLDFAVTPAGRLRGFWDATAGIQRLRLKEDGTFSYLEKDGSLLSGEVFWEDDGA